MSSRGRAGLALAAAVALLAASAFLIGRGRGAARAEAVYRGGVNFVSGDLVFRRGLSAESHAVLAVDGRTRYSHVGIVRRRGDTVEVIHASFGEEGRWEGVIVEPLEEFLKPSSASAAAVMRLAEGGAPDTPLSALREAERLLDARTPFDDDYDLDSTDKLYCTELVWAAYKSGGVDLVDGKFDSLPRVLGGAGKPYLLPGSLYGSAHLRVIWTSDESETNR